MKTLIRKDIGTIVFESESEVAQSCPTLCDPVDCSPPGSSIHGILQAQILEWGAIAFSRGSSRPLSVYQFELNMPNFSRQALFSQDKWQLIKCTATEIFTEEV